MLVRSSNHFTAARWAEIGVARTAALAAVWPGCRGGTAVGNPIA